MMHAGQSLAQYGQSNPTRENGNMSWGAPFPSLHLWPIQDTFAMKMIHLPEGQRIKIGRQTNNKTVPGERNAYFDSKVLSRTHAEIWEQAHKMFIKDLKSSNGTFVNNERLSPEGMESEPFEIKSEDIVEFGIDIVSEDNRTIVHHKVAAKVYCVFNADDVALSARELVHYQNHDPRSRAPNPRPAAPAGAVGPVLASGGKPGGLTFDHVLSKLQAELQKSKDVGADLQSLNTSMGDIQDALGGGLPPSQNGSATHLIPPQYRNMSTEGQAALNGPHGQQAAAFISLQNQLGETQASLTTHLDKIHHLEGQVKDHQSLQVELASLREQMEASRREMDQFLQNASKYDDDDARSVVTLMDNEESQERVIKARNGVTTSDSDGSSALANGNADLVGRIQDLSAEIAEAVQATKSIQTQHSEAMAAVRQLTQRIGVLEEGIATRVADEVSKAEQRWEAWRNKAEDGWRKERESWEAERERLRRVVREWEESSRRGREEVEDQELNARLSGDEYDDEEDDDEEEGAADKDVVATWTKDAIPRANGRRARRRRPSHRTTLAVRALKAVADDTGTSTPKADTQALESVEGANGIKVGDRPPRAADEDSSSGKESVDTLKELDDVGAARARRRGREMAQKPIHIYTVLVVAVVAGALYWKHKE